MKMFVRKERVPARLTALLSIVALIGIDRLTKWLAAVNLNAEGKPSSVNLINVNGTNVLNFTYVENTGAAFSILQGQRLFLILMTGLLVTGVLIFLLSDRLKSKLLITALTLIVAGGAGNLIDRVFYGYVIDFIDFRIINFAIFNFADICVTTGTVIALIAMIREEIMSRKQIQPAADTQTASENETVNENVGEVKKL
ncbi:MAG: signal peptidase II [Oscillospiraceae bacterium]|nr:signal peptidase II [Oscillospiraceae bacterium]